MSNRTWSSTISRILSPHDGFRVLAAEILTTPILLCSGKKSGSVKQIDDARSFIKSDWAMTLMDCLGLDSEGIIQRINNSANLGRSPKV